MLDSTTAQSQHRDEVDAFILLLDTTGAQHSESHRGDEPAELRRSAIRIHCLMSNDRT